MPKNDNWLNITPPERLEWFMEQGVDEDVASGYLDRKGLERFNRLENAPS